MIYFDETIPRFGIRLRRNPSGLIRRDWLVQYRYDGKSKRYKIGSAEVLSAERAHNAAKKLLGDIALGGDPLGDRQAGKITQALRTAMTQHEKAAARYEAFSKHDIEPKAFLYRHYAPGGDLLYCGITLSIERRTIAHM